MSEENEILEEITKLKWRAFKNWAEQNYFRDWVSNCANITDYLDENDTKQYNKLEELLKPYEMEFLKEFNKKIKKKKDNRGKENGKKDE